MQNKPDENLLTISEAKQNQVVKPFIPQCEKYLQKMFLLTFLPAINSKYKIIQYITPIFVNIILISASFCLLYYPSYYPTQGEIWTTDIVIVCITYNYMIYLFRRWKEASCFEDIGISKSVHYISLAFYVLYLLYWLYFAVIQFITHNQPSILIQLGNTLMSTAWFIFFSTISVLYYFVCIKLAQRASKIREWLKDIKKRRPPLEVFYLEYNGHYKSIKELGHYWNILIFIGFLLLTFHVPIDVISIIYRHYYYDIFGLVVKLLSLLWYTWRICDLNEYETYLVSYLYKHRVFPYEELQDIEKYSAYRPLGLNFFGLKINKAFIIKVVLLTLNLILPTIYALFSNNILK